MFTASLLTFHDIESIPKSMNAKSIGTPSLLVTLLSSTQAKITTATSSKYPATIIPPFKNALFYILYHVFILFVNDFHRIKAKTAPTNFIGAVYITPVSLVPFSIGLTMSKTTHFCCSTVEHFYSHKVLYTSFILLKINWGFASFFATSSIVPSPLSTKIVLMPAFTPQAISV